MDLYIICTRFILVTLATKKELCIFTKYKICLNSVSFVNGLIFLRDIFEKRFENKVAACRVNKLSQILFSSSLSLLLYIKGRNFFEVREHYPGERSFLFRAKVTRHANTLKMKHWSTQRDRFTQTEKKSINKEMQFASNRHRRCGQKHRDVRFWKLLSQTRESTVVVQARLDISWGTRRSRLYSCLKLYSGLFLIPFRSPFLPDSRSCLFIPPTTLIFSKTYLNSVSLFHS